MHGGNHFVKSLPMSYKPGRPVDKGTSSPKRTRFSFISIKQASMMSTGKFSLSSLYVGILAFALTLVLAPKPAQAQSNDLNVYGFFQTQYSHIDGEFGGEDTGYGSFRLPQLNVYFAKDLGSNFSAFVSTEYLNTYNSGEDWGIARLGEGWVRYQHGQALKVQGGLLIPKFNNLNEIKNRTPLLPYVTRPLVYEQSFRGLANIQDYVPQRAYVQVYGTLPAGAVDFDYAAYVGNSESGYIATGESGLYVSSTDTTYAKLFGGRVGVQYQSLKVGVSGTVDETNMRQLDFFGTSIPAGMGDVDRYRIGADLSFDVADFFVESEIISVQHSLTDQQKAQWDALNQQPGLGSLLGEDLDQLFYYGMIGYNITNEVDIHAMYDTIEENRTDIAISSYGGGISYRPVFPVRLKAEYRYSKARDDSFSQNTLSVAASVTF